MQLRTLAGLERKKIEDELAELMKLIAELEAILADEKKILGIIKDEMKQLKSSTETNVERALLQANLTS